MATKTDAIFIQIGDKKIEAKGEQLEYIKQAQVEAHAIHTAWINSLIEQKAACESAMAKLKALGLTDDEISALVP